MSPHPHHWIRAWMFRQRPPVAFLPLSVSRRRILPFIDEGALDQPQYKYEINPFPGATGAARSFAAGFNGLYPYTKGGAAALRRTG